MRLGLLLLGDRARPPGRLRRRRGHLRRACLTRTARSWQSRAGARRDPARRQGPDRHRRPRDDVRLGDLPRARARADGERRASGSRRPATAIVGKTNLHEFAYGITSDNPHFGAVVNPLAAEPDPGRLERRERAPRWRPGSARWRSGRTAPGRSACRRRAAASSASSRPGASCRPTASSRSRPASTRWGRWRATVGACAALMRAVRDRRATPPRGRPCGARLDRARRPARSGPRRGGGSAPPDVEHIDFPLPGDLESGLPGRGGRRPPRALRRARRPLRRERAPQARGGVRGLRRGRRGLPGRARGLPGASSRGARGLRRPAHADDADGRASRRHRRPRPAQAHDHRSRARSTRTGWPALALPCGPAEDGLPASLQIAARPGDDALVLAVGAALEQALSE